MGSTEIEEAVQPQGIRQGDHIPGKHVVPAFAIVFRYVGGRGKAPEGHAVDMEAFAGQRLLKPVRVEKPGHGGENHTIADTVFLIVQAKAAHCNKFTHDMPLLCLLAWSIILQKKEPEKLAFPEGHAV